MSWLSTRVRGPWLLPLTAALVGAVLLSTALVIQRSVREASALLERGTADAFSVAGFEALRDVPRPPPRETLEALLEANAADGLRGVAVVDEGGRVLVSAGEVAAGPLPEGGVALREGERVRVLRRYPPMRVGEPGGPEAASPRPPGGFGPHRGHDGPPRGRLRVLYAFEPLAALRLEALARGLLWVASVASLLSVALATAVARGLAQRERMAVELERGRRLAALGEMSGVLAHELRNPLASLKGHAQLLHESLEDQPRLHPKAGRVVSEALRLEQRMNDLLAFVRTGELHLAPADPNAALRAAVEAVGGGVEARYLEDATPWPQDTARLQQALENVLRNAQQASPEGGRVEAEVALEGGRLHYRVRDSGAGIAPGDEERIFEPFVTRKVRGVGLGLAVTRRIVELHGGRVRAANRTGGGAEFVLELPRNPPRKEA